MPKDIVFGDNQYRVTEFYKEGVRARREFKSFQTNPYQSGSLQYYDWDDGFDNEDEIQTAKEFREDSLLTEEEIKNHDFIV